MPASLTTLFSIDSRKRFRAAGIGLFLLANSLDLQAAWERHTIDATSLGADGVRLQDVNGDGRLDVATGWEQGGVVRIYLHPGPTHVREPWPQVTVGQVQDAEDAVFADLDQDGAWDVLSSCEGRTRSLFIHWSPPDPTQILSASDWTTQPLPASHDAQAWMFALPLKPPTGQIPHLIVGSKGNQATISRIQLPANRRQVEAWRIQPLYQAGWIMSLRAFDMDFDGDLDVLASDRKGPNRGVLWLANPHSNSSSDSWQEHRLGANNQEVMFLDVANTASNGAQVVAAVKPNQVFHFERRRSNTAPWQSRQAVIKAPTGTAKASSFADIDLDGELDIVSSCEHASEGRIGVYWFPLKDVSTGLINQIHDISGPVGTKFDRLEAIDLDEDGDLDVMTCEEVENLGVIWYENPTI